MMSRKRVIILCLSVLMILFIALIIISGTRSRKSNEQNISLIVYGNDSGRWENLYQGAKLALKDYDAEVSLITMSAKGDANEQIELIEREIASGADGILLAACDKYVIGDYLNKKKTDIPIVLVESGVIGADKIRLVSVDDYDMGATLGKVITERERNITKVAIIRNNTNINGEEERYQGVNDTITPYVSKVVEWKRNTNEGLLSTQLFLQRELVSEAVDVVVALDNETADALMDALSNLNKNVKVYCISTSDKSVYSLDQDRIIAIDYQTEFAIGYEGAMLLMDDNFIHRKAKINPIYHKIVTKEDMYDFENQKLIFPFVK